MEWKPIETAPMDKKAVLVYCPDIKCIFCVFFEDGLWFIFGNRGILQPKPTHWMPLPEAPNDQGKPTAANEPTEGEND